MHLVTSPYPQREPSAPDSGQLDPKPALACPIASEAATNFIPPLQ
jgi:hypothetical protein